MVAICFSMFFQDAVNIVLRNKSIQPHWMFALDSLVRSAVHASIVVVSPELYDAEPHPQPFKQPRTSKPSTIDSLNTKASSSSHEKGMC